MRFLIQLETQLVSNLFWSTSRTNRAWSSRAKKCQETPKKLTICQVMFPVGWKIWDQRQNWVRIGLENALQFEVFTHLFDIIISHMEDLAKKNILITTQGKSTWHLISAFAWMFLQLKSQFKLVSASSAIYVAKLGVSYMSIVQHLLDCNRNNISALFFMQCCYSAFEIGVTSL